MALLSCYDERHEYELGCDEAGRGCLAGPVFAAAVIFPKGYHNSLMDDSKKLSEKKRLRLREMIVRDALAWSVASVDCREIDRINILNASLLAMHQAIDKIAVKPDFILVDGNRFKPYHNIEYETIIKGDGKYISIAAASILAKTFRDEHMRRLAAEYPQYAWEKNKGYGTREHLAAIRQYGFTEYHRRSFHPNMQLKFDF